MYVETCPNSREKNTRCARQRPNPKHPTHTLNLATAIIQKNMMGINKPNFTLAGSPQTIIISSSRNSLDTLLGRTTAFSNLGKYLKKGRRLIIYLHTFLCTVYFLGLGFPHETHPPVLRTVGSVERDVHTYIHSDFLPLKRPDLMIN